MSRTPFPASILLLALISAGYPCQAEESSNWPRNANELQVSLSVVYALEEGPFVCKVQLKNVSKRNLEYAVYSHGNGVSCQVVADWKTKKQPLMRISMFSGFVGLFARRLAPGESASHTFYLHRSFLGVPAGDVSVRFAWDINRTIKNPMKEGDSKEILWRPEILHPLFSLKRTETVKVLPATKENVARVLRSLETKFALAAEAAKGKSDYSWMSPEPAYDFLQTIGGCRRQEFAPLLLRAMDCLPGSFSRSELVRTVYDSFATPQEGFNALADYLTAPRTAAAVEVFEYWNQEEEGHKESKERRVKLRKKPKPDPNAKEISVEEFRWANLQSEEDAWQTSKRHLDARLTKEQFGRLRAMKSVWVRALLFDYFPAQCSEDWLRTLRADLRQVTRPPERLRKLLRQLDDDRFEMREQASKELLDLRDAFAVYLWDVRKNKHSLEVSRRLRLILDRLGKVELPPLPRRTIAHLAWSNEPHSRQMLAILRQTDPANLITEAARSAFEEHRKHEEKHKEQMKRIIDRR